MSDIGPSTRVCPRCGEPAGDQRFCGDCGLNLGRLAQAPTRAEWLVRDLPRTNVAPRRGLLARGDPVRLTNIEIAVLVLAELIAISGLLSWLAANERAGGAEGATASGWDYWRGHAVLLLAPFMLSVIMLAARYGFEWVRERLTEREGFEMIAFGGVMAAPLPLFAIINTPQDANVDLGVYVALLCSLSLIGVAGTARSQSRAAYSSTDRRWAAASAATAIAVFFTFSALMSTEDGIRILDQSEEAGMIGLGAIAALAGAYLGITPRWGAGFILLGLLIYWDATTKAVSDAGIAIGGAAILLLLIPLFALGGDRMREPAAPGQGSP